MCTVDGCAGSVYAKNICSKHYQRLRRYGRLESVKPKREPTGFCYECGAHTETVYCSASCGSLSTSKKYNESDRGREARQDIKHRRRQRITGSKMPPGWKAKLLALYPVCLKCGADTDLTVDHVIPLSLGGRHEFNNLQTLCKHHNCSKGSRFIDYRP